MYHVTGRFRGVIAAIVNQGDRIRPKNVKASNTIGNTGEGGVVLMDDGVGHFAVTVVRSIHQESSRIT